MKIWNEKKVSQLSDFEANVRWPKELCSIRARVEWLRDVMGWCFFVMLLLGSRVAERMHHEGLS